MFPKHESDTGPLCLKSHKMFILNFSGSLTEVPCPRLQVRDGYPFPWVGGGGEWKGILSTVAGLSK